MLPSLRIGLSIASPSLQSYLSCHLQERLARTAAQSAAQWEDVAVAVLLSDMKGFTAIVEKFSKSGRAGLEELTWALNRDFAELADVVDEFGGDVVSVAGDAFLCVWSATSPEELPNAVALATNAGLAIQSRLGARSADDEFAFATRIGIGAGIATLATVGGTHGRWELLVSGAALRDAVRAEHAAQSGQVSVAPSAWSLISARADGVRITDGNVAVTSAPSIAPATAMVRNAISPDLLRAHVPAAVLDRLQMPSTEWLAESRPVTVMFAAMPSIADLVGTPAERVALTHDIVREFQAIVSRFEGTAKVDMDDKGTLLLAIWGLPPRAHEDDATRAIQAAWALSAAITAHDQLRSHAGIGMASGRAICGAFGSDRRRDYMIRGDVINLAARLMSHAGHAVTCDDATVQATRGAVTFESLPPVQVKGRMQPVSIFRPTARRTRAEARAIDAYTDKVTTVGRTTEWAQLRSAWQTLHHDAVGGIVVIEGEPGLGKSTLVTDLAQHASRDRGRVWLAAADAIDRSTPYFAWRPLFAELLNVKSDSGEALAETMSMLATRVRALNNVDRLLPLLSSVLPIRIPDNELTAEMSGDVRADNTRRLLVALLQDELVRESRSSLLLVEDAHWLDSASAALLLDVARDVQPLLAIVTSRPAAASFTTGANLISGSEYTRLLALPGASAMRLEQLGDADTNALVSNRLGVSSAPAALLEFVRKRVAGHPFFCDELVQALLESGVVTVRDGTCTVGDLSTVVLPTTVEGMIVSRLDRLNPSQQLCLKIASVVGRVFRERTVAETHPVAEEVPKVPQQLNQLTRLELTTLETSDPDYAYRFRHITTRDVTYELMTRAQRQPLHRAVAEWIEREHADAVAPMAALLSYHWTQAGDVPKSVDYLEMAGDYALRDGAFNEAAQFFGDLLVLVERNMQLGDAQRRARWHKGLGTARYFLGDLAGSRAQLELAVATLDRPVPADGGASVLGLLRAAARQTLNRAAPGAFLGKGRADRARLDDATDCYRALGQIYYLQSEPAPRLAYLTVRGVNVGESAGPSPALARILANMGTLTSLLGRKDWSDWYGARAVAMAEQEGQYAAAAYVWHIEALRYITNGRIARALEANASAQSLITQLGDFNLAMEAWSVRAMILATAMDCAQGTEAARHCIALARRADDASLGCWAQLNLVEFALADGDTAQADAELAVALEWTTAENDFASVQLKQRGIAIVRAAQTRWSEAIVAAQMVLALGAKHPPTAYYLATAQAAAVEVLIRAVLSGASNDAALQSAIARGAKSITALAKNFWNLKARAPYLVGLHAESLGKRDDAIRAYTQSAQIAAEMEMSYERSRAQSALTRLRPIASPRLQV